MAGPGYFIFYIRANTDTGEYQIYKIPLFPTEIDSASGGSGSGSALRRCSTLPSASTGDSLLDFSLHRRRLHPARIRPMPIPYRQFHCNGLSGGMPEEMAIAALGSCIYLIGGHFWKNTHEDDGSRTDIVLSTNVYIIFAASPGPPPPAFTLYNNMNSGKRSPVAWTIGGKIYVMPSVFVDGETPGHFECYDEDSDQWTILPSPPFFDSSSKYTIRTTSYLAPRLLLVDNHIVLGSSLIITTHGEDFHRFDTAEPNLGWRSVCLKFGSERLRFLPFDPRMSVHLQDGIIFSHVDSDSFPKPDLRGVDQHHYSVGRSRVEKRFLKSHCDIRPFNSYICGIKCGKSSTLKLSFVSPVSVPIQRAESVVHGVPKTDVSRIGDGLILFVRRGFGRPDHLIGDACYSLNVVRIQEQEGKFVASSLSSALFTSTGVMPDYVCSFLMKDGEFTSGF